MNTTIFWKLIFFAFSNFFVSLWMIIVTITPMRILYTLIFLFFFTGSFAQELSVKSFVKDEMDLTANQKETIVLDQNGEKCALIRIETTLAGFSFDVGSLGVQKVVQKTGEVWVYVPHGVRRIVLRHKLYGTVEYNFPISIEKAKTYKMNLHYLIEGEDLKIRSSVEGAYIIVDGDTLGTSPQNIRLPYGRHTIAGALSRYYGEEIVYVEKNGIYSVLVSMEDVYGDFSVNVPGNAEIWFEGKRQGVGTWKSSLREGTYVIETRKSNHENRTTTFTVMKNQSVEINAIAPEPYHGFVQVTVSPHDAKISHGETSVNSGEKLQLQLGPQTVTFSRKGYIVEEKVYNIKKDEVITDNIELERFYNVKRTTFYLGGAYTISSLSGLSVMAGATYKDIDVQASYTIGMGESDPANWYSVNDNSFSETSAYKMNQFALKFGYQLKLSTGVSLTPQLGFISQNLSSSGSRGDGVSCSCLSLGAKLLLSPITHVCIYLSPEYSIAMKKSDTFTKISNTCNFSGGGFASHVGVLFNL